MTNIQRSFILPTLALTFALAAAVPAQDAAPVYMANGIKIGEASSTSVIVWTRLTQHPERNVAGTPFPLLTTRDRRSATYDDLGEMEGSVPGAPGDVRVVYWPATDDARRVSTGWRAVDTRKDCTSQILLSDLEPGSRYLLIAQGRPRGGLRPSFTVEGRFRTAPAAETPAPVRFAVVTGQEYLRRDTENGHRIYPLMQDLDLDFFVHTGDIEYYDKPGPYADSVELARFKWNRIYALPFQRSFHNATASYFMKDDHDTLKDDCWPGQRYGGLSWPQGLALFREQVPMGESTYRTVRWGKDLQVWFVEGRDFRSPNTMPDGPEKSIWGPDQKAWFFDTVRASDATFRVLISPTPIVGPDRSSKNDNHANRGFTHEGNELRSFIASQKNMFIICGDRHWQYVSEDPETGAREYSCGPTSDAHAGGFSEDNRASMHRYLKIKGGFLSVLIERIHGDARAVVRHYGVDGTLYHEDIQVQVSPATGSHPDPLESVPRPRQLAETPSGSARAGGAAVAGADSARESARESMPESDRLISRRAYAERLYGFWLGQCIANWTGLVTEMDKIGDTPDIKSGRFYTREDWGQPDQPNIWNPGKPSDLSPTIDFVFRDVDEVWGADDDTDIEYMYQHLLATHETSILSAQQIRDGWLKHIRSEEENYLWVSNERAYRLFEQGILPPHTSHPDRNPDGEMIDAQLTTEIFGLFAPSRPDIALKMAHLPVRATAWENAAWISEFYITLYSLAACHDHGTPLKAHLRWMAGEARKGLPEDSYAARMYDFVDAQYVAQVPWEHARDAIHERYQVRHEDGYDMSAAYGNGCFAAGINFAASLVSLFYGEGDLKETIKIGALAGWDSDNPTATWGGLLGFMLGKDGVERAFARPFSERYDIHRTRRGFPVGVDTFSAMAERGVRIVDRVVAEEMGGRVDLERDCWVVPKGHCAGP